MDTYLGFDIGTSAIKAVAIDADGRVLSRARVPCGTVSPHEGWFEVEPEKVWRKGFLSALSDLGAENVRSARAVCVSSLCATFVPTDGNLNPVYNAILYGIDTRASEQVRRLNSTCARPALSAVAGGAFTSHSVFPKLMWLKETLPDVYGSSEHFLESVNYITSWLTGEIAWDLPSAAGGHMIDVNTLRYPSELIAEMGLDERKLPPLANPLDVLGTVTAAAASETGLPAGAIVLTGACDINAEAFACGAVYPGDLTVVYGSTVSTLFVLDSLKTVPGFLTGPSVLPGTFRIGGATSSGGRYLDWAKRALALTDAEIEGSEPERPSRIVMIPFLDGARTPVQAPHARVLWYGMSSASTRADLWTAARESMGYELFSILERMREAARVPDGLYVMGGLASDARFLRIVADITGKRLTWIPDVDASYGDALMALARSEGRGEFLAAAKSRKRPPAAPRGHVVLPDPAKYDVYGPYRRLFCELSRSAVAVSESFLLTES